MDPQTMQRGAPGADPNPTAAAERAADETLERLTWAREDADMPDDAIAEQAWRRMSRLASRLSTKARALARSLEAAVIDQRELVAESLLEHPESRTGARPR